VTCDCRDWTFSVLTLDLCFVFPQIPLLSSQGGVLINCNGITERMM